MGICVWRTLCLRRATSHGRMILIDFDWGGKDGEVEFPHEELIETLRVLNNQLYGRKIRKEHDLKCFEKVVEWLDLAGDERCDYSN